MITLTILILVVPVILLVALFTRKTVIVSRQIIIRQPAAAIFSYLRLLKNQDSYHKQIMVDPTMKKEFQGTDGNVGFIYAWDSKNRKIGKASEKIISLEEPVKIVVEINFQKPLRSIALLLMELTPADDASTEVKWTFQGNEHPYYLLRVGQLLFMVKKAVAKDIEQSLKNLKVIMEK